MVIETRLWMCDRGDTCKDVTAEIHMFRCESRNTCKHMTVETHF